MQKSAIALFVLLVLAGPCARGGVLFSDDFTGSTIDSAKWTIVKEGPQAICQQNENLQMWWDRSYAWMLAVSAPTFDVTADTVEVNAWQDTTSDYQGYPVSLGSHLGLLAYYNANIPNSWRWTAEWTNASGGFSAAVGLLGALRWTDRPADTVYSLKIHLDGDTLEWYLDIGDGQGYQLAYSTKDFSVPFQVANFQNHVTLGDSDSGWTFYDDLRVTPEPATLSLLALGGLGALFGRRRK